MSKEVQDWIGIALLFVNMALWDMMVWRAHGPWEVIITIQGMVVASLGFIFYIWGVTA